MSEELGKLLVENCSINKLPDDKIQEIIETVQEKQKKILARKYVDINYLRNTYVLI